MWLSTISRQGPRSGSACAIAALLICADPAASDHLLLSEVHLAQGGEFIEIVNPTDDVIALDHYYLADDQDYLKLPAWYGGATSLPNVGIADFVARFPAGASIAPDQTITIAINGSGFADHFGFRADYEVLASDPLTTDMIAELGGGGASFTDAGECLILFFWDGASDLVKDVDMLRWGSPSAPNDLINKTTLSVDGPDADSEASQFLPDAFTIDEPRSFPAVTQSLKRIGLEGALETTSGGNGITGHDETSENILLTWDFGSFTAPNPGVANLDAPPSADVAAELAGPSTAAAGDVFTLALTISNPGTLPAVDVEVTADLPAGANFQSQTHDGSGLSFEQAGDTLRWSMPSLTYSSACSITLELALDESLAGDIDFTIAVTTTSAESNSKNNVATISVAIENKSACTGDFVSSTTFQPPPDGTVNAADLAFLLGAWGAALKSPADMVTSETFAPPPDGIVNAADLATLLGAWGVCP